MADVLNGSIKMAVAAGLAAVLVGALLPEKLRGLEETDTARSVGAHPSEASDVAPSPLPPRRSSLEQSAGGMVVLDANPWGQFSTDVAIEGRYVPMMVDTGASAISLSANDAGKIGIHPRGTDFRTTVTTANGRVLAAAVHLREVRIGSIVVHDVVALVAPEGRPTPNLLGMTFLKRLRRFEISGQRLLLEQ